MKRFVIGLVFPLVLILLLSCSNEKMLRIFSDEHTNSYYCASEKELWSFLKERMDGEIDSYNDFVEEITDTKEEFLNLADASAFRRLTHEFTDCLLFRMVVNDVVGNEMNPDFKLKDGFYVRYDGNDENLLSIVYYAFTNKYGINSFIDEKRSFIFYEY